LADIAPILLTSKGVFNGVLGEEGEKPEVGAPEAVAGAEAFAAEVVARLSEHDPGVARKTEEFLSEQTQLLKVQREHLKDEHEARLQYLRDQVREMDTRRFGLREPTLTALGRSAQSVG